MAEWQGTCCRQTGSPRRAPPLQKMGGGELKEPVERLIRRLGSYDRPQPPPELKRNIPALPTIHIAHKDAVISSLQPHVRKLQQIAELYTMQISEHAAIDCQFNDLVQHLYNTVPTKMTFKKCCKPTCARNAIINISFAEARLNESVKHQMQTNRQTFKALVAQSLQPHSQAMVLSCLAFEHTIDVLRARLQDCLVHGDGAGEARVRDIGVEYFYYLLSVYSDEFKIFPPSKQLLNVCMEKLGQIFIRGVEVETARLCKTILHQPSKSDLITPYFCVVGVSTSSFLQMYSDIIAIPDKSSDVEFTMLSKFDVSNWLSEKRPRLCDRSKFIQLIFNSLAALGPKPANVASHELFRRHLLSIFRHEFPEHYGEILLLALQNSGAQNLSPLVWMDMMNALVCPSQIRAEVLKDQLRHHATHQKMLQQHEIVETLSLLGRYFANERLQFGLYGLYPKYRSYTEPLSLLCGLVSHALVIATLHKYPGLLADQLCDVLWPIVLDMFSPWLIPYWLNQYKDATAAWIQQLADDRSVLLPWIAADVAFAQRMFGMFTEWVLFIIDTLPACNNILCYVWQFYSSNFAHPAIKEHVSTVVHSGLLTLPWERFWPSLADLDIMLKVVDQYLPECHTFLGHIFLAVNWPNWLSKVSNVAASARAHHCLLHLLVKLSNEPNVKTSDAAQAMVETSRGFSWQLLDVAVLEQVLDWYVMSCDPRVALDGGGAQELLKPVEYSIFGLLKVVACYDPPICSATLSTMKKRQSFVRAFVKLLVNCSSRHKALVTAEPQRVKHALVAQLDHVTRIIGSASLDPAAEADVLVSEVLVAVNNATLQQTAVECVEQWLGTSAATGPMIRAFLRTVGNAVVSPDAVGTILEKALESYFGNVGVCDGGDNSLDEEQPASWGQVCQLLRPGPVKQPPLETSLAANGKLLSLHAVLLSRIANCDKGNACVLMDSMVDWLATVKPGECTEYKMPLLWDDMLTLTLKLCSMEKQHQTRAAVSLKRFCAQLLLLSENKGAGWGRGLLGAMGIVRQCTVSAQCRFLCKAVSGYILAQLPEPRGEPQTIRCAPGAPCAVGHPGGNAECAKVLLKNFDTGHTELRPAVELALKQIQDPQNSMHNAVIFLYDLVDLLYSKSFLIKH